MKERRYVGFEIHSLDKTIGRRMDVVTQQVAGGEIQAVGTWIIGFICRQGDRAVYQKDVERKFCMPPSTVTKILKQLEKDGLIRRVSVENDARLKKLEITDKGMQLHKSIIHSIHSAVDLKLTEGISDEEMETLFDLLDRIRANAEAIDLSGMHTMNEEESDK